MRPPPTRVAGRRARGAGLASLSDESPRVTLSSAAEQRLVPPLSSPEDTSRSEEGQGEGNMFRVGDAVLASTNTRNPTLREASVVEVDPSDGSRVKIAFRDKRKKGGWREKCNLSALLRPSNNAGSASSAEQPPSDSVSSGGAVDAGAADFRTGPASPERGSKGRTKASTGGASSRRSEIAEDEPKQKSRRLSDTAAIGALESAGAAEGAPTAAEAAAGTAPGAPGCYRVGDAVLVSTAGKPAHEATVVEVDPYDGSKFKIAFRNKRKKGGWRDKSDLLSAPVLRRAASARSTSARPPPSGSAPSVDAGAARGGAAADRNQDSAGVRKHARSQEVLHPSGAPGTAAGAKTSGKAVQLSAQPRREPPGRAREKRPAAPAAVSEAIGNGEGISPSPKRKRSAATAAAAAISSSSSKRRSGVGGGGGGGGSGSAGSSGGGSGGGCAIRKPKPVQKKGTKANRRSNAAGGAATAAGSGKTTKTPRRKDWQRPKVVTPGSVEGRPELALRNAHPTEIVRPRRQFKVQQARVAPRARSDRNASSSSSSSAPSREVAHRSPFSIGLGGGGKVGPRRMLCQPAHSVRDANRGLTSSAGGGGGGGGSGRGERSGVDGGRSVEGAEEENEDSLFVRRGRRVRRQVHPSLSEDTMAAVNGGVESDFDDSSGDEGEGAAAGGGGAYGDAPFRFRTSEAAPWGHGDRPLMKVRLSLLEGGGALSAERSALAVVTFVSDRHRYSGEQLANVLTAEGFLCYRDEDTRVFVLTESKKADQGEALRRVRELALARCGVEVEVAPWLEGRPALDEFLDNHRRVLDHIVRHRLACGMWTEVGGVYFNALFCGRRSKRTFNGVRLGINLAVDHNRALESGVWELWMTVEPAVHRFSPVDWWALMNEKENKGLKDFSGSKSDDLEERLQVVCLPKLSRGVVHDVKEDAFEMDVLQEANLRRGYLIGPTSEDEMVEYWRQVHHLNLPSTNFQFVKVRIGGMVLTYPSWCVVRGQREVPDATRAMRSRILESFADALDGMEGVRVMETTFPWPPTGGDGEARKAATTSMAASATPGMFDNAACWATAGGRAIEHPSSSASPSPPSPAPDVVAVDGRGHARGGGGVTRDGDGGLASTDNRRATPLPSTPGSAAGAGVDGGNGKTSSGRDPTGDDGDRSTGGTVSVVTPHSSSAPPPPPPLITACRPGQQQSPESRAAAAAAQAAVGVVRQSFVRRRGTVVPRRVPLAAVEGSDASGAAPHSSSAPRLCSTPFVIRRQPPPPGPPSAAGVPAGSSTGLSASGGRSSSRGGGDSKSAVKRRPLDLSAGERSTATLRGTGGRVDGAGPATPCVGVGTDVGGATSLPTPTAARVVTPAAEGEAATATATAAAVAATAAAGGARRKKRKESKTATPQDGGESSDRKGKKRSKKAQAAAAVAAAGGEGADGASTTGVVDADTVQAAPAAPIVVVFSAEGSLGMGMEADALEEGTMCLAGKAPTSAAAAVPDGWRITAVNGKCARRLGDEKIAALLTLRPVEVTFEEATKAAAATSAPAASRKRAAPTKSKAAPVTKPKAGTKGKALKGKGKGKARAKKADKVTTVRKAFKVQARGVPHRAEQGGEGGGSGGGGGHAVAAAVQASSTSAVI